MGAWSVVILLALMLAQVFLGLFSEDVDGLASGPLSYEVSYETGLWAADMHEDVFDYLIAFIVLHIVFVFFYLFYKKDNLIAPMISGQSQDLDTQELQTAPLWLAALVLAISAGLVWLLVN